MWPVVNGLNPCRTLESIGTKWVHVYDSNAYDAFHPVRSPLIASLWYTLKTATQAFPQELEQPKIEQSASTIVL